MQQPYSFMTRCITLPDLYAGKMNALIYRAWQHRVKGRDWYDFDWFVRWNVPLNFAHYQVASVSLVARKSVRRPL